MITPGDKRVPREQTWRDYGDNGWTPTPLTDTLTLVTLVGVLTGMVWTTYKLMNRRLSR